MSSLGSRGGRGALLGTVGQFGKLGINLASLAILSRLLPPEDYGRIAIIMATVGVAELIKDMGLSGAAVQSKTLSLAERSNLWWINVAMATLVTLAIIALSPIISAFFNDPSLAGLTCALSFTFLLSGMTTQYRSNLFRDLRFGLTAAIDASSGLIALLAAVVAAQSGWGIWALVLQQLLAAGLGLVLIVAFSRWLPRAYNRNVPLRRFFSFGIPSFLSSILTYYGGNIDAILLGRVTSLEIMGQYNRAMQLIRLPMSQIRNPLNNAAFSTLSRTDSNRQQYDRLITKAQLAFLYPTAFITTLVAATSTATVSIILGSSWERTSYFLLLFALGDTVNNLSSAGGWIYMSQGKTRKLLTYTFISAGFRVILFLLATPRGIDTVAWVYLIAPLTLWPFSMYYCHRATGYNTTGLFIASLRVFIFSILIFAASFSLIHFLHWNPWGSLMVGVITHTAITTALWTLPTPIKRDLRSVFNVFRTSLGR